ncbi:hypothetical protein C9374_013880 [Naegleria lovaniensis]|uniref:DUF938 domain-containing protein n=1 Tax=Naegleria lovaniensis TaxID=51637 RepID=A0AA88KMU3_NAELO|nr:uncharacterized protein C9374_013880 [Naegleria lovaniensis]KAG2389320.1 hypothetical protein C9374_013880 [Naegleria lovaniensis]
MSFSSNYSEAAERNKEPIRQNSSSRRILEIASGYGQHVSHFARSFPSYEFQPSELTSQSFESIVERCKDLNNVQAPIIVDISQEWEEVINHLKEEGANGLDNSTKFHSIIAINLLHISPWKTTLMLMQNASQLLQDNNEEGGYLFIYGPFNVNHEFTSEGNKNFDEHLKSRCEEWGIRDVQDVEKEANLYGLKLLERISMPANNFTLVFKKMSTSKIE